MRSLPAPAAPADIAADAPGDTAVPGHIPALDGLRGTAILMVMAVHFIGDMTSTTPLEGLLAKLANYGTAGVDLFFVLSGFLITGILYESKGKQGYFRNFYARRTLRIFPLYYAILIALFVLLPVGLRPAGLAESARHQAWAWAYGTNFFLAERGSWALPYIGHFWSLAIEEHFYLVWPLVVWLSSPRWLVRICAITATASLLLRLVLSGLGVNDVALYALTPCRLDSLCVGSLLAVAVRLGGRSALLRLARPGAIGAGLAVLGLSAAKVLFPQIAWAALPLRTSAGAVLFGSLILLSSFGPVRSPLRRVFEGRWLRFIGKYSYGLYVYHGIIAFYFVDQQTERWLSLRVGSHLVAVALQALLGLFASLALSIGSYELFEKRFLRLKSLFETRAAPKGPEHGKDPALITVAPL